MLFIAALALGTFAIRTAFPDPSILWSKLILDDPPGYFAPDGVRSLAVGTGLGRSNRAPSRDHLDRCRGSRMVSLLALDLRRAHSGFPAL